ncbi:hypothetical protein ACFYZU_28685 [Streptomyces sp. NPDC001651]
MVAVRRCGSVERKFHMVIALGAEAAMQGYRVCYTLATQLESGRVGAADS